MIYDKKKPILSHIELSNICNAMCPQCGRNTVDKETGELKMLPGLNTGELLVDDYKNIFDDEFYDNFKLKKVNYCGNRSDPIATKHLHEVIEYTLERDKDTIINVATNGGLKTTEWWYNFGKLLSDKKHLISFGIDGLSDTHSLYRINTNFEKVIANAESFIKAGGKASWQFLVFSHNEHQIDEAKSLAKKIGFIEFKHIFTPRFLRLNNKERRFNFKNKEYVLKESSIKSVSDYIRNNITDDIDIQCKAKKINEFFLDYDGNVFPCCWLGQSYAYKDYGRNVDNIMQWYDNSMNALKHSLTDILTKSFFLETLEKSWKVQPCYSCKKFCNKKINSNKQQFTTKEQL